MAFGRTVLVQLGNLTVGNSYEDLRVRFSITKTLKSEPNSGNIEIYGLNRESVAQYLALDRDLRIRLLAGYEGTPSLLFDGFPVKKEGLVFDSKGAERVLKIKAKDGLRRYEKARVNVSLDSATTLEDMLIEVAGSLGLPVDTIEIPPDAENTQGIALVGQASDVLDRIALSSNADWSIQDGKFQFLQRAGYRRGQGPLFATELRNIVAVRRKDKGIEITTFINGSIVPGTLFRVRTEEGHFNGDYKATEVKYTGDSLYDNDFYAVLTGMPYTDQREGEALMDRASIRQLTRKIDEGVVFVGTNLGNLIDPNYTGPDIDNDFGE